MNKYSLRVRASVKNILIVIMTIACIPATRSKTISTDQFIQQLKNSNEFVHAKLATEGSVNADMLYKQMKDPNYHLNIAVDDAMLQMASGVKNSQHIWQFNNPYLNMQFTRLFKTIASSEMQLGFRVNLTRYDLFHGHVFAIYASDGALSDLGILLHAKEYPRDLKLGNPDAEKNSPFTTKSIEYGYRNFIWLASTGFIYDLDGGASAIFPAYFLPEEMDGNDSAMRDIVEQYLRARTFMLDNLRPSVEMLGDVNYFIVDTHPTLFFTY